MAGSGTAPPSAYENALTDISKQVRGVSVGISPQAKQGVTTPDKQKDADKSTDGKARPRLVFYKVTDGGDPARLSRKFEQIVLFTQPPPEHNNANSHTKPDFRSGLAAKYFDIETVDVTKGAADGVSPTQAPVIVVKNSAGEEVARANAGAINSGALYATLTNVLRDEGLDVRENILKAHGTMMKLYLIEIEIQKLKKRTGKNIDRLLKDYEAAKAKGHEELKEILSSV